MTPSRIIFSRKGFDSSAGCWPNSTLQRHRFWRAPGIMAACGQWQEGVATADEEALHWAGYLIARHAA